MECGCSFFLLYRLRAWPAMPGDSKMPPYWQQKLPPPLFIKMVLSQFHVQVKLRILGVDRMRNALKTRSCSVTANHELIHKRGRRFRSTLSIIVWRSLFVQNLPYRTVHRSNVFQRSQYLNFIKCALMYVHRRVSVYTFPCVASSRLTLCCI